MQKPPSLRSALVALLTLHCMAEATAQDVRRIYREQCASCHGQNLEGGLGGSLVDGVWRHGADDESVARVIRDGVVENGMPGYGEVLDEAQTRSLVVYIREMATQAAERQTDFNRPLPGSGGAQRGARLPSRNRGRGFGDSLVIGILA